MSNRQKQTGVKGLIIGIILVCLVLGYYFYLSNRKPKDNREDNVKATAVQEVLMRNLDTNYPPTPREVLRYYCEIAKCLHNETYTDEEFQKLALQIQMLYDEELVANKTQDQYMNDLKLDIEQFAQQEIVISSYTMSSSTDVKEFRQDGYSWARLYGTFTLRKGTNMSSVQETFVMRRDEEGHWKIYGWELTEEDKN